MRAEGEFTLKDLERAEDRLSRERSSLRSLESELARKKEAAKDPKIRDRAKRIGRALKDDRFKELADALTQAYAERRKAEGEFRKCKRYRSGGLTKLGRERKKALRKAELAESAARVKFTDHRASFGLDASRPVGFDWFRHWTEQLRAALDAYKVRDLPDRIAAQKRAVGEAEEEVGLIRSNQVPRWKLKCFRGVSSTGARKRLVAIAEGYVPKPKTVSRGSEFSELIDLGLLRLNPNGTVSITDLGQAVADLYEDLEGHPKLIPALSSADVRSAFSPGEIKKLRRAFREGIKRISDSEISPSNVEVVLPGPPKTVIRVPCNRSALRWALFVLSRRTHPDQTIGAQVISRPTPTFTPGKIIR